MHRFALFCLLLLASAVMPMTLAAHNTLFGDAPRTIWKGGLEVEAETQWELHRRFFEHDSSVGNPLDTRVHVWTWKFALTYGITKDIAIRAAIPVGYAIRRSKNTDLNDHYFGLKDISIGFKFRLYNEPQPGGSFQSGLFIDFMLPTAQARGPVGLLSEKLSFGDEVWGVKVGATWGFSTLRHYFWLDIAAKANTLNDGRVMGPSANIHPAYAFRFFELNDYREFDMILLIEADAEVTERMYMDKKPMHQSGYYKFHVGLGLQMNITNRVEMKLGYEWPVYQYYFMKTFVHEGEAKISFNYLF
jgi:hypothetical protein